MAHRVRSGRVLVHRGGVYSGVYKEGETIDAWLETEQHRAEALSPTAEVESVAPDGVREEDGSILGDLQREAAARDALRSRLNFAFAGNRGLIEEVHPYVGRYIGKHYLIRTLERVKLPRGFKPMAPRLAMLSLMHGSEMGPEGQGSTFEFKEVIYCIPLRKPFMGFFVARAWVDGSMALLVARNLGGHAWGLGRILRPEENPGRWTMVHGKRVVLDAPWDPAELRKPEGDSRTEKSLPHWLEWMTKIRRMRYFSVRNNPHDGIDGGLKLYEASTVFRAAHWTGLDREHTRKGLYMPMPVTADGLYVHSSVVAIGSVLGVFGSQWVAHMRNDGLVRSLKQPRL